MCDPEFDDQQFPVTVEQVVKYAIAFFAGCIFWWAGSGLQNWGTR